MSAPRWRGGWWGLATRLASPHFNERPLGTVVDLVVLHSISLPPGRYGGPAVERLFLGTLDADAHPSFAVLRGLRVSAHFVIRRRGEVQQFVSCEQRAWHAGASAWAGRENCNDFSIGIELEGLEGRRFTSAQMDSLATLLRALRRRHPITAVVGHEHVAPGRKHDPGAGFDWAGLRACLGWRGVQVGVAGEGPSARRRQEEKNASGSA